MKKYDLIFNLNSKTCLQKTEFTSQDDQLINFFLSMILFTSEDIMKNLNIQNTVMFVMHFVTFVQKKPNLSIFRFKKNGVNI